MTVQENKKIESVIVFNNYDEIIEKAERYKKTLAEAKELAKELASAEFEISVKTV